MVKKMMTAVAIAAVMCVTYVNAQDSTKKAPVATTTWSGSVDAYYRNDFAGKASNNLTSFTNSNNSFELGMASIRVDHSIGKVAATIDLGFGRRAEEFSYNDVGGMTAIKQAYLSYAVSDKVKITAGKWATHIGWELLDAYANRNYSMSYGFSYGPFFHTGVKADISFGGKSAMMIGIANPTDHVTDNTGKKVFIAQFTSGSKNDKFKAYLNYQGGTDLSQFDLVLNGTISSKFAINYDGTVADIAGHSWSSNALYFCYDPTSMFGLTLRGEYFKNTTGALSLPIPNAAISSATSIFIPTLSASIKIDGSLTIIPEIRMDNAKDAIFIDGKSAATKTAGNFLIAATYKF